MNLNITTPTLMFSAITLLLLAYTNRFLAIAALIRQFIALYHENPDDNTYKQIEHFKKRLKLIKYTQLFGVISFILCVICMILIFTEAYSAAQFIFITSLIVMIISLCFSLYEILISIGALNVEIIKLEKKRNRI